MAKRYIKFFFVVCCCLAAKSCPTLCNPMGCSPPGSSVRGILLQGTFRPGDQTQASCITGRLSTVWAAGKSRRLGSTTKTVAAPALGSGRRHARRSPPVSLKPRSGVAFRACRPTQCCSHAQYFKEEI